MRRPKILGARLLAVAALPVALVVTGGIVAASSYSVFTSTSNSPSNGFSAGSVVLTNDSTTAGTQSATGSALYSVTGITPTSQPSVRCLTVQSTGSVPSAVHFYTAAATTANPSGNALAQYLTVQVEIGTAGSTCGSFTTSSSIVPAGTTLAALEGSTSWSNGKDTTWAPTGAAAESRPFRFTVTPSSAMPNSLQGASTGVSFVWEADNT
ncbi:hypothetical protein [Amnibacterium kyonggiense]